MLERFKKFFLWVVFGFFQEKVPLWLHIVTICGTLVATLHFAPVINAGFERQKIKSSFVVDSLESINNLTGDLAVSITAFNYCELNKPGECISEIKVAQASIVRLQWKAVQLRAILTDSDDRLAIQRFQRSLDSVAVSLNARNHSSNELDRHMSEFGEASVDLVTRVARQAGIEV